MKRTFEQRVVIYISALLAILVAVLWLGVFLGGEFLVEKIVEGKGAFAHLQRGAAHIFRSLPADQRAAALLDAIKSYAFRVTTVYLVCQAILLIGSFRKPNLFRDFFQAESHPLNLAVLRIVFFVTLIPRVDLHKVLELVQVREELRVAPPGLGWFAANLPAVSYTHLTLPTKA